MATKKEIQLATFEEIYEVDEEKSAEGVKIEWGFNAKDQPIQLIIAESGNEKHQKARRKYEKALESSRRNRKRYELVMAKIVAEGILVGWNNILDTANKPVPPTVENKVTALSKYERLFIDVLEVANNPEHFRPSQPEEETEKNSGKSSAGPFDTEDT